MNDTQLKQVDDLRNSSACSAASDQNGVRLVVGANRGIGLALLEAQLERPDVRRVIATYRPASDTSALEHLAGRWGSKLAPYPLDVTRERDIRRFSSFLQSQEGGIDLAIHAAGILHTDEIQPEKTIDQCDIDQLRRMFEVNSVGPLMVAGALLPAQSRKRHFVFTALSAMVGSIEDNRLGGWYGYRASKTALNQFIKTLANECRVRHPNAAVIAVHPGTTDTELSRPFQKSVKPGKLYAPQVTAQRILQVTEQVSAQESGQFINWDGSRIPW
jgi:NAD(P)-dependent dehydrogenase (short-subunit alcohol dehydrogenase family)